MLRVGVIRAITTLFSLLIAVLLVTVAYADNSSNGLLISPPRFSMSVDAGGSDSQKITVANHTEQSLDVTMSVQEFSVADLSYTYQIKPVDNPWLHIEQTALHLEQGKDTTLTLAATVPHDAPPGGKYYLIVASATTKNGALASTIQVAAPVYITVNGQLDLSNKLQTAAPASHFIVGDIIPFHIDVKNTGNVHYNIDVKGHLTGPLTSQSTSSSQHLLLPGTTRRLNSSIPAPVLPGIYHMFYGYSSSADDVLVSTWILYVPPWSIVAAVTLAWGGFIAIRFVRRRQAAKITDSQQPPYTLPK